MEEALVVALSAAFPAGLEGMVTAVSPRIEVVRLPPQPPFPPETSRAEVLAWWAGRKALVDLAPRLPRLRWLQSPVAGVGDQRLHELFPPGVTITGGAGVYANMVAEHALMLMLALVRRLPDLLDQQRGERWDDLEARSLDGATLGIVGAGGIGRATARLGRAFGMRTIGIRRGEGDLPELDRTLRRDQLPELLRQADVVVLAAPRTPETTGMVDQAFLAAMRPSALLINVARGKLVVTDDLAAALRAGRIAGAGLDVTDPEPLPPGHPLWHLPNVIITPHHANPRAISDEPAVRRLCENLRRYLDGAPLLAVVDPALGY